MKETLRLLFNDFSEEEEEDTIECFYPEGDYVEYQAWQIKKRYGNVLPTKWGQRNKFNKYCFTNDGQ